MFGVLGQAPINRNREKQYKNIKRNRVLIFFTIRKMSLKKLTKKLELKFGNIFSFVIIIPTFPT